MKVKELIEKLKKCNPEAELTVGDNFYNGISISYGYSDGCTEENCEYVCFDVDESHCDNSENEKVYPDSVDGRMKKFYDEHCFNCAHKSCFGVYNEDWRDDCELFKEEFKDVVFL